jgi:hypothetical protein
MIQRSVTLTIARYMFPTDARRRAHDSIPEHDKLANASFVRQLLSINTALSIPDVHDGHR